MSDQSETPPTSTLSPEQAAEMQEQLAQYLAQQASEAAAARAEKLKPLTDLFSSDAWNELRGVVSTTSREMIDEPFFDTLRALDTITGLLPSLVR